MILPYELYSLKHGYYTFRAGHWFVFRFDFRMFIPGLRKSYMHIAFNIGTKNVTLKAEIKVPQSREICLL